MPFKAPWVSAETLYEAWGKRIVARLVPFFTVVHFFNLRAGTDFLLCLSAQKGCLQCNGFSVRTLWSKLSVRTVVNTSKMHAIWKNASAASSVLLFENYANKLLYENNFSYISLLSPVWSMTLSLNARTLEALVPIPLEVRKHVFIFPQLLLSCVGGSHLHHKRNPSYHGYTPINIIVAFYIPECTV